MGCGDRWREWMASPRKNDNHISHLDRYHLTAGKRLKAYYGNNSRFILAPLSRSDIGRAPKKIAGPEPCHKILILEPCLCASDFCLSASRQRCFRAVGPSSQDLDRPPERQEQARGSGIAPNVYSIFDPMSSSYRRSMTKKFYALAFGRI